MLNCVTSFREILYLPRSSTHQRLNGHIFQKALRMTRFRHANFVFALFAALAAAANASPLFPDASKLAAAVGLTPESLVVADVTPVQASAMMTDLVTFGDLQAELEGAMQDLVDAKIVLAQAEAALRLDPSDEARQLQVQQSRQNLANSELLLNEKQSDVFTEAVAGLPPQKAGSLQLWISAAGADVPAEFRVLQRSEDDWKAVEKALRAERRALRRGEALEPAMEQLLTALRTEPAVVAAKQRLDSHLPAMKALFDQYTQ